MRQVGFYQRRDFSRFPVFVQMQKLMKAAKEGTKDGLEKTKAAVKRGRSLIRTRSFMAAGVWPGLHPSSPRLAACGRRQAWPRAPRTPPAPCLSPGRLGLPCLSAEGAHGSVQGLRAHAHLGHWKVTGSCG